MTRAVSEPLANAFSVDPLWKRWPVRPAPGRVGSTTSPTRLCERPREPGQLFFDRINRMPTGLPKLPTYPVHPVNPVPKVLGFTVLPYAPIRRLRTTRPGRSRYPHPGASAAALRRALWRRGGRRPEPVEPVRAGPSRLARAARGRMVSGVGKNSGKTTVTG